MLKVGSFLYPVLLLPDDEDISTNGVMLKVGSFLYPVLLLTDGEGISTNDVWCWKLAASCTQFYYWQMVKVLVLMVCDAESWQLPALSFITGCL